MSILSTLKPVRASGEFYRVQRLPTATPSPLDAPILRDGGTMRLWPLQNEALAAARDAGGLFAPLGVGAGKTLVCWLLPTVLNAKRAVYLTQAKLVGEALAEREKYAPHFNIRDDIDIKSYAWISNKKNYAYLVERKPELIIADEGHALRNPNAVRTRRFLKYMYAHPQTAFAVLSGTITKRSLMDYAHLVDLALKEGSFMPRKYPLAKEWAEALDVPVLAPPRPPGALLGLAPSPDDVGSKQVRARKQFRRRMVSCKGVVASDESALGSPLFLKQVEIPLCSHIQEALSKLKNLWQRPDDFELVEILDKARIERQLKVGGFYRFVNPSKEQLEKIRRRNDMTREVNKYLKSRSKTGLDSPSLLLDAVRHSVDDFPAPLMTTVQAHDAYAHVPWPEVEWAHVCSCVRDAVTRWSLGKKVIIFTDIVAFGQDLAAHMGVPYYGAGDDSARAIRYETGRRSVVASRQAHGTGRNLQMFAESLFLFGSPDGDVWEQTIGRLHRPGQTADVVTIHYLKRFRADLSRAKEDARYKEQTTGNSQKLLLSKEVPHAR